VAKQLNEKINECASNKPFAIQIYKMTDSDTDANTLTHVRFAEKGKINYDLFSYKSSHKEERLRTFRCYR